MSVTEYPAVLAATGLTGKERGNVSVSCPLHDDGSPSASINFEKGLFNCYAGCGGMKLSALEDRLAGESQTTDGDVEEASEALPAVTTYSAEQLSEMAQEHLSTRGFDTERLVGGEYGFTISVQSDPHHVLYGYLVFELSGSVFVARNLLDDGRPKYRNSVGRRLPVRLGHHANGGPRSVWLVEGILDAVALHDAGAGEVVPTLGTSLDPALAFSFRGRRVFVLFDTDYAGFAGAKTVAETLRDVGAYPEILELPAELGTDPAEAWADHPEQLTGWVSSIEARYAAGDAEYVANLLLNAEPLLTMPSGVKSWDALLGGGFKPGVHVLAAPPKSGKTALALAVLASTVEAGFRALYLTYEIPKRQAWMRLASIKDEKPWSALEGDPTLMSDETRDWVAGLAARARIEAGWTIDQIRSAVGEFDLVVVDYLQRMPSPYRREAIRHAVSENIGSLSDLARDHGKVVLVVSSLPRGEYGRPTAASFKESGDIEYVVQSATAVVNYPVREVMMANVMLNTRGSTGTFWLSRDLGHLRFAPGASPKVMGTLAKGVLE